MPLPMKNPYSVPYNEIRAIVSEDNSMVELVEFPNCFGGAGWTYNQYVHHPSTVSVRQCGNSFRYLLRSGRFDTHFNPPLRAAGIIACEP
ncbi:MAG: methanogenesis marker protein 11, partial [Methermicoccaceae archaeon]